MRGGYSTAPSPQPARGGDGRADLVAGICASCRAISFRCAPGTAFAALVRVTKEAVTIDGTLKTFSSIGGHRRSAVALHPRRRLFVAIAFRAYTFGGSKGSRTGSGLSFARIAFSVRCEAKTGSGRFW
jgi:hypothetical protein